jgi:uncharacterized protein (DUF486 family)
VINFCESFSNTGTKLNKSISSAHSILPKNAFSSPNDHENFVHYLFTWGLPLINWYPMVKCRRFWLKVLSPASLKKLQNLRKKILELSHLFFLNIHVFCYLACFSLIPECEKYTVLYKFTRICPQYPNCLNFFQKIKIDLYKEPLSNSGKTES